MPITKINLSGSTLGRPLLVPITPTATIHTTGTSTSVLDAIYLWVYQRNNGGSAAVNITLSLGDGGGTTTSALVVSVALSPGTQQLILNGLVLTGNGTTGSSLTAVSAANVYVYGYVNRIS